MKFFIFIQVIILVSCITIFAQATLLAQKSKDLEEKTKALEAGINTCIERYKSHEHF